MSPTRRPVAPLLGLQATALVVLTVSVGALFWVERATYRAEVEAPAALAREVRAESTRALALPYGVAATRDAALARQAHESIHAAKGALADIVSEHGQLRGVKSQATKAKTALTEIESLLANIEASAPGARLTNAFTELDSQRLKLEEALSALEAVIASSVAFHYDQKLQVFLALWAGAMVVTLVSGMEARRRTQSNDAQADNRVQKAVRGLGGALRQALEDEEVQASSLPAYEEYGPLTEAVRKSVEKLDELHKANKAKARSNNFLHELQEALSLAETERSVLDTAGRAAAAAYRNQDFQLIAVDLTTGEARFHLDDSPQLCEFSTIDQCPALDQGRTWHHRVDDALARCPRLNTDDVCVTCAPLHVSGQPAAVAQLSRYDPLRVRFEELEALALATAVRLSVTRHIAARTAESETCPLTGLANRRVYERKMAELDEADLGYALVMADLDHFKQLNDQYGHEAGDRCLEIFAQVLRDASRDSDLPVRLGGEEFVIVLPNVGVKAGLAVAMRVRAYLADAARQAPAPFTVSLGVAARPDHGNSAEAVLRAADAALYDAKEAGRNQVVPARMHSNLEAAG